MHHSPRPLALVSALFGLALVAGSAGVLTACGSDEPEVVPQAAPSGAQSQYSPPPPPVGQAGDPGSAAPGGWPPPPPPGGGVAPRAGGPPAAGGADPFSGRFRARVEGVVYDLELARHDSERWTGTLSYGGRRVPLVGVLQGAKLVGLVNDPSEGEYGFWGSPSPDGLMFEIEDDDPVAFRRVSGQTFGAQPPGGGPTPRQP